MNICCHDKNLEKKSFKVFFKAFFIEKKEYKIFLNFRDIYFIEVKIFEILRCRPNFTK